MRKLLVLAIISLIGGSVAAFFYYSRQASEIPRWYQVKRYVKNEVQQAEPLISRERKLRQTMLDFQNHKEVKLQLSSQEVNELIKLILIQELGNREPKGIPDGIQSIIDNNQMEVGGIVNLTDLEQGSMSPEHKEYLSRIVKRLRQFADRDIYLGVEGKPVLNGDRLELSRDGIIRVGNLKFTKSDIAKLTGFPQEKIQARLALKLKSFKISQISIDQDKLNLTIQKK